MRSLQKVLFIADHFSQFNREGRSARSISRRRISCKSLAAFALLLTSSLCSGQNTLYSYCDGWDVGDLTNGVLVHFDDSIPDGTDVSITVNEDGHRVCFEMRAVKGTDTFARQYDCGNMQINPYGPVGPSLITFGPFDESNTVPEDGSVVVSYASNPACPHGFDVVTLVGDVYIGPIRTDYVKRCDKKQGGNLGECGADVGGAANAPGMAVYSAHALRASLTIADTPFRYTPPRGPAIDFTVTYNQRDSQQPHALRYSNFGHKWAFNWLAYVSDDPTNPSADANVYVPGGGLESYTDFDAASQSYRPDLQTQILLVRTSSSSYERRFPDGSKQVFDLSDGSTSSRRRIFMTRVVDPQGNAASITFDENFRITAITDALGQVTTLSYELPEDPLKITRVSEPFPTGRSATFGYTNGQLTSITDEIGIQSQFHYSAGSDFIDSLTTPYGTSTFATGSNGSNKWLEMTDPLGAKERVEYLDNAPGIGDSDPPGSVPAGFTNSGLAVANTFYWDKKSIEMYPPVNGIYDYTKARITHWLRNADGSPTGVVASEKAPLENRIWYAYAGQFDTNHTGALAEASKVARVLGDGSTQLSQYEYNSLGHLTKSTDPVGRTMSYVYDSNNIDLLEIRQTTGGANELVRKLTYNTVHEPLTETDAAGQPISFTYNAFGQLLTRKNAKNEITTYNYGDGSAGHPAGYISSITSPLFNNVSAVTSCTYDSANRIRTVTDSDGYTVTVDYDNLDRPTQVTYLDGTNEQFMYSEDFGVGPTTILDLTASKDRRELWTTRHYNANRQMDSTTDPLNRTTQFGWCNCGSLATITDPKNQTTTFNRDLQGRVYQKVFPDNSSVSYLYDGQTAPNTIGATSRLKSVTDAKNQRTNYFYFADENVQQITYTNTSGQPLNPPTPSVSFSYDPNYNRIKTMLDGTGTTTYSYNPITTPPTTGAGQLASIDTPIANDLITFAYDELGRVITRSINGTANASSWTFDSLGRVANITNKLGTFTNNYVGVTNRLSKVTFPGGTTANYSYFPNVQDKRLQEIKYLTPKNALISQFDYTYDTEGQILTWTKNYAGLSAPQRYDLGYDHADQLVTAPLKNATTNALIKQYSYGYDVASNRTSELVGTTTTTSTPNILNEIVGQSGGTNRTLTYDANGSIINDGSKRTFEWDAANRLKAINYTGTTNRTEFAYDGLSRIFQIVEKQGTTIKSTRKFVWCGMEMCEYRDAKDAVTLRLYPQGQYSGTTPYYYTRDHLGSIREMLKSDGSVQGRYDYDPYGRSTTLKNTVPDFNFTGLYRHSASNLDLAVYRAYDPDLGRWLNRDPIGQNGGPNQYIYANNNSTNGIDPDGLLTLLIHGTILYGSGTPYFGQDFVNAVSATFGEKARIWGWSGADTDFARQAAGLSLALDLLNYQRNHPCEPINIVAHSHGGNVAFIASQFVQIDTLVTLGTPIREYAPNLSNINELINAFSVSDSVQSLLGGNTHTIWGNEFGRACQTLPYGGPVENREVLTRAKGKSAHSELITPGVWGQLFP